MIWGTLGRMETPSGTLSRKETTVTAISHRSLLYALVIAAGLATNPFVNMGFSDDWAYSQIAVRFAQTGHIEYGKWAAAAVLVQTVYGALLTKLFGGTFVGMVSLVLTMAGRYYPTKPAKMMGKMTLSYGVAQIIGPAMTGWLATQLGSYNAGLYVAAGVMLVGTALLLLLKLVEKRDLASTAGLLAV